MMTPTTTANPKISLIVPITNKISPPGLTAEPLTRPAEQPLKVLYYRRNRNIAYFPSRAKNDFDGTFGNLFSHCDSKGDPDQIGILELDSGPLVAVIEDDVESGSLQAIGDILRGRFHALVLDVSRGNHDLEWRDRGRQPESVLIVALLDCRSQDALDTNAITTHNRRNFLAVLVEHPRAHFLGIAVAEFEDVPNLNRCVDA